ncbi:hypothetical protein [Nonomuraea sp. NPDC050643]|uniref:hypothetical protein n=1 Tax=Nonomuraea sp. NPDC050643 TaxID=3155660 RepID=UPI0033FB701D
MQATRNRYCKIFTTAPEDDVKALLVSLLGGRFNRHGLLSPDLDFDVEVEVRRNPDRGLGFLGWPHVIELEEDGPAGSAIVEVTTATIQALWDADHEAVAACDFEDRLPFDGGIKRLRQT